jgi:hypothetical protein
VKYLPHKHLAVTMGSLRRDFWDISQFYHSSLDKAAKTYLHERKIHVGRKDFYPTYVRRHWKMLRNYCVRDAQLTARLADYFKEKLNEFGVEVHSLYSPASLAFHFFSERIGGVVDIWDVWQQNPDAVRFAHESYQGGKFECVKRGAFRGFEYDIVSAYPFQMRNLIDIRGAQWVRSRDLVDAPYSWLFVTIRHRDTGVPPCHGLLLEGVRVYSMGDYQAYITRQEYEYLTERGIDVRIHDGWHCVPNRIRYPYRDSVDYLFGLKDKYKGVDKMLYSICKLMMNSYYGRMANVNGRHEPAEDFPDLVSDKYGEVTVNEAGAAWNPFYASMITANTRIMVSKLQEHLGEDCLAVHTDSVICTKPLPDSMLSPQLGGLDLALKGEGLLVMSGLYDFGGHTACRGTEMKKGFSWTGLLSSKPMGYKYSYPQTRVVSWTQAAIWQRFEDINLFESAPKVIDINADVKRNWLRRLRGKDLLHGIVDSLPRTYMEV